MTRSFCHLHVHTEYSLLDGAARISQLLEAARSMDMPAIAITDHGVMYGAIDFYLAAKEAGVKPIIGAELYVAARHRTLKEAREKDGNFHLTVLAQTDEGYRNLMRLVSAGHLEGYYYRPRVDKELLAQHASGLIATTGCLASETNQALLQGRASDASKAAGEYRDIFGPENFFFEVQNHGLADQKTVFDQQVEISRRLGIPLLATNDLHYTRREDAAAHDVLLCIQTGSTINEPDRFKFDAEEFYLKSPEEMYALFSGIEEACDATLAVAERCNVELEFGSLHLPPFEPPVGRSVEEHLRNLTEEGARKRYGDPLRDEVRERIEHELSIIVSMGFASYFLIVADLIGFARRNGIRVGPGRGSAAGSVVSYCLGIVDIDPLRYGLIFERFLNPGRREMPDIDMDFDERRRGEVIRYVTERYGEDRVAQIVTFATIKGKQAIRDAARVLGYPYGVGDRLAKMYPPAILGKDAPLAACFESEYEWPEPGRNDAYPSAADLRKAYTEDEISQRVLDIARQLEGLRRQDSVHAAGVVIGDRPLVTYTPLQRAEDGEGGIVTQYEMHAVEKLGLLKMDFLGLRNLTVIEDTLSNLRRRGITLDIDHVPLDDTKSFEMLSRGDTIGVFQLESPGMRELCKKLRPDRFEDVMALVALYRPGPLGEGMHMEYANRKHGKKQVQYLHPDLEPILEKTYGIICFQEQCLQIAVQMAGFSIVEADTLRKAIGKKIGKIMRQQERKFVDGCVANGYSNGVAAKLWEMIEHFSGYGFNLAHACGYAYIAYQTGYLKANHPLEYMAALLTSVKGNQDRSALYLAECRVLGITVDPPDVNASESDFTPVAEREIRFGLSGVRNVGENVVAEIARARGEKGAFTSFADFCRKVDPVALNRRVVESLAKAGAFDSLAIPRSALLTTDMEKGLVLAPQAAGCVDHALDRARNEERGQFSLFGGDGEADEVLRDPTVAAELSSQALLAAEKEMLGLYVSDHPLLSVEPILRATTNARASDVASLREGDTRTLGGLVTRVRRRFTKKGESMATFMLEDLDGAIEIVIFPSAFQQVAELIVEDTIVCVKGRVDLRDDQPKIVALELWRPNLADSGEPLVLSVRAEVCTPELIDRLKEVLVAHAGPTQVHLKLTGGEGPKLLRLPSYGVERRNGLYTDLKAVLGPGAFG